MASFGCCEYCHYNNRSTLHLSVEVSTYKSFGQIHRRRHTKWHGISILKETAILFVIVLPLSNISTIWKNKRSKFLQSQIYNFSLYDRFKTKSHGSFDWHFLRSKNVEHWLCFSLSVSEPFESLPLFLRMFKDVPHFIIGFFKFYLFC